jgi:hypothetical protein
MLQTVCGDFKKAFLGWASAFTINNNVTVINSVMLRNLHLSMICNDFIFAVIYEY